jgi:hypothetical protein
MALGLLLVTACTATAPIGSAAPEGTVLPDQTIAGQTLEPTPTRTSTTRPTPTPNDEPEVTIVRTFFETWKDSIDYVHYQTIVEVENTGASPADLDDGDHDFAIYDKDGAVLTTGRFSYAFPQVLQAGELGYYIDSGIFDEGTDRSTIGKIELESMEFGLEAPEADVYDVAKVRVTQEPFGDGLQVTGVITNTSTTDAESVRVAVVFFDANGNIIGALYDNTVDGIPAGKSKAFKTSYPGTPPMKPSAVKSFKAFAYDYTFL